MTNTSITDDILHCPICRKLGSVVKSVRTDDWRLHCRQCDWRWFHPQQASMTEVASAVYEYAQNLKTDEAMNNDAEMFRWLSEKARIEHRDGGNSGSWCITGIPAYENWIEHKFDHKTFRGAIRAAMKKEQVTK